MTRTPMNAATNAYNAVHTAYLNALETLPETDPHIDALSDAEEVAWERLMQTPILTLEDAADFTVAAVTVPALNAHAREDLNAEAALRKLSAALRAIADKEVTP